MKTDVSFHVDGDLEQILSKLIAPESPLKLNQKIDDWYMLDSQDPVLTHFFCYGTQDPETTNQPLHENAQKVLGFKSGNSLTYGGCYLNPEKIAVFKKIMEYIVSQKIPAYMTVADYNCGEEHLVTGCNPKTGVDIKNDAFDLEKRLAEHN